MAADRGPAAKSPKPRLPAGERRNSIVDAAREVFVQQGLAGARTRDIANAAGVTEALLYRHFRSKEELFEVAVVAPLAETAASIAEAAGSPDGALSDMTIHQLTREHIVRVLQAMAEIAPLLGIMLFRDESTAAEHFVDRIEPHLAELKRVMQANVPHWQHSDFDAELLVQVVFGGAWFRAINARFTGMPIDIERDADQFTSLILDGLRAR